MKWIIFSYSLPAQANTLLVTLWRRIRRLGAISPNGIDYFQSAHGTTVADQLNRLRQQLVSEDITALITTAVTTQYQDKRRVTRPHSF